MKNYIDFYTKLDRHIVYLLIAEFFLQFINSSFFLLLNYYFDAIGLEDYQIADLVSYRFLAVMLFAFPLGFFIKGKKVKPFFLLATVMVPTFALIIIFSAQYHYYTLLKAAMVLWGVGFTFIQITALPFMLLNTSSDKHSESITAFFQTWSISIFICGIVSAFLLEYVSMYFDEKILLLIFSFLGYTAIYFILKIDIQEKVTQRIPWKKLAGHHDWGKIIMVCIPTFIIAIGAGFTIPFINLFFLNVHGIGTSVFSILGSITYALVAVGMVMIPNIRRRYGYEIAITFIQTLSILALVLMATTEWYTEMAFAVYIAVTFYIIRQPLMNMAGPMTSELSMYYVGDKNHELVSALNASIWSGSWFISGQIFRVLRAQDFAYVNIFLITAGLYAVGVIWYYFLIRDFNKQKMQLT